MVEICFICGRESTLWGRPPAEKKYEGWKRYEETVRGREGTRKILLLVSDDSGVEVCLQYDAKRGDYVGYTICGSKKCLDAFVKHIGKEQREYTRNCNQELWEQLLRRYPEMAHLFRTPYRNWRRARHDLEVRYVRALRAGDEEKAEEIRHEAASASLRLDRDALLKKYPERAGQA